MPDSPDTPEGMLFSPPVPFTSFTRIDAYTRLHGDDDIYANISLRYRNALLDVGH